VRHVCAWHQALSVGVVPGLDGGELPIGQHPLAGVDVQLLLSRREGQGELGPAALQRRLLGCGHHLVIAVPRGRLLRSGRLGRPSRPQHHLPAPGGDGQPRHLLGSEDRARGEADHREPADHHQARAQPSHSAGEHRSAIQLGGSAALRGWPIRLGGRAVGRVGEQRFQLRQHVARMRVAMRRIGLEELLHDRVQPRIQARHPLRGEPESSDGQLPGEQLVEDHAHRVEIRAPIHVRRVPALLRRHVVHGTHGHRCGGEVGLLLTTAHPRQPEVRHLGVPPGIDQDVLRLQIAVDDLRVVRALHRPEHLGDQPERLLGRGTPVLDQLAE
jgi:hypothetical protein